jgi:diguanylate cyclase (GGDEF)-like protein
VNYRPREHWPVALGAALAVAVVLVFGILGVGESSGFWTASPLGVRLGVWGSAVTILAASFAAQLALHGRDSLQRERRLVQTAAALREATAQLERLATTDALTSILNRRAFFDRYGVEFRRSLRYGRPLAVIMLDLDDFKVLNDRWGHPFGDYVLAEMARVITSNVRESDVTARYGGEEFVLLLPETTRDAAVVVAEKLRAAVAAHEFRTNGMPPRQSPAEHITISAGVTGLPSAAPVDSDELVSRADRALYQAKRAGKNRVVADDGKPAPIASGGETA